MKFTVPFFLLFVGFFAFADTPPPGTVKAKMYSGDGNTAFTATGSALNVNVTNTTGLTTVNQGTAGASAWLVDASAHTQPVSGTLTCNAGSGTLSVDGSGHTQPVSGTVAISGGSVTATNSANSNTGSAVPTQATQIGGSDGTNLRAVKVSTAGVVSVDGSATTQPVSAASLPLPAGAATQTTLATVSTTLGSILLDLTNGTQITSINGTLPAFAATPTFNLGTLNGAATAANQATIITALGSPFQAGGSIGNTAFGISGTLPAFAATPTFNLGTLNGAATASNQTTGNTSLATIATNIPAQGQALAAASMPVVLTAAQVTTLTPPTSVTVTQATGTNLHTVVDSSALPTNAATASAQTTAQTSLSSIVTNTANIPAQGQALAAGSVPVVLTAAQVSTLTPLTSVTVTQATGTNLHTVVDSGTVTATVTGVATSANQTNASQKTQIVDGSGNVIASTSNALNSNVTNTVAISAPVNANATLSARQTVTGTESTVSAPTHTVGVILECESVNADNLRWGFSNSGTAILSSTLGLLCEPGRDSGFLPMGAGTVLHLISTGGGSDFADVQWVLSQ